ncbi:class I SAM-dependent methyltransferase [archaeon]|jgi:ubiquinone/menaquinone biosynthesis C-methylase UbiE|nr:class I SAM-dependent methyltransferase [archaeon]MBT6182830.1 class I SAM-dependent methyltransferase [archaeon]MBT6606790.1 class I SAM-dependent methyltransferase [archaeon]MBT7251737.1 class I SAM-dependent methyltransferase [archaeon]MBT7660520.1 class I SAM-dependent methyltransferase [archaeon]
MVKKTNIDYWERIVKNPGKNYKELFEKEKLFLRKIIKSNSKVLDIGCGDGRIISEIKDIPKEIFGIDFDKKAVEDARERFSGNSKIKIMQGSAFKIDFKSETFDYVLLMMTLVNFSENKLKTLSEMSRVLKENGSIILSVYSDSAFNERKKMYEKIEVPIEKIEGTKFIFRKNIGANESEQFSIEELTKLCNLANLNIEDYVETKIGLICEVKKIIQ